MTDINGRVVAITGASSGIGEATAQHLAKLGAKVVLGARRIDRLEKLVADIKAEGGSALAVKLDVTQLDDMKKFVEQAEATFGPLDVLVNNAGIMPLSAFQALKIDEWNQTIDVNIRGVLHGIAAALPGMKARGAGHFINVSSIGGHFSFAGAGVYCASKFAVVAISDALRQENTDVRCTVISPGVVDSELASTITDPAAQEAMVEFRKIALKPDAIARAISFAISQPDDVDVNEIIVRPTASPY